MISVDRFFMVSFNRKLCPLPFLQRVEWSHLSSLLVHSQGVAYEKLTDGVPYMVWGHSAGILVGVRRLGSAWRFFCGWTVACWQVFSWYIKLWLQLWRISCQCLSFWNPLLLVVCHWIIRHSWNSMAAPVFELGSEEPWSNKRPWIFGISTIHILNIMGQKLLLP